MNSSNERIEFCKRLQKALNDAEYSQDSPTQLAREFNLRFAGNPVTVHAARKWLQGESIPTQEKLRALAEWLDVPAEWLRFGSVEGKGASSQSALLTPADIKLLNIIKQLDEHHQAIVNEIVRALVRTTRKK